MKRIFALLVLCFVFGQVSASAQDKVENKLVGVWQASEAMGSGWSDTYRFFSNGKFVFHANQMDCAKRIVSQSGTWTVKNNIIYLTITERVVMVGGKLVPAVGSCGSDYELVDAQEKKMTRKMPWRLNLTLGKFTKDDLERLTTKFGKTRFWKYNTDPTQYP